MGERLAGGAGHHHAVEVLGLALEVKNLAVADIRGLGLQRAAGAPDRRSAPRDQDSAGSD